MRVQKKAVLALILLYLNGASLGFSQDFNLQYFLAKAASNQVDLSSSERLELFTRLEELMRRTRQTHDRLVTLMLSGEVTLPFQEGHLWMSKFMEDRNAIETGTLQLKWMKERPSLLAPPVIFYKSLKDLASNFHTYNNAPSFSAFVGDLAPDLELWADSVFYRLYLLPLARARDKETEEQTFPKEKKPVLKK